MDLNKWAAMPDDEAVAWLMDPANIDPERKTPRVQLTTIANTWNAIAADLLAYAFEHSEQYAVTGAANTIIAATANLEWDATVTIDLSAHPIVKQMAANRGAR